VDRQREEGENGDAAVARDKGPDEDGQSRDGGDPQEGLSCLESVPVKERNACFSAATEGTFTSLPVSSW
jgi:hypothetical protein